jgi:multidrug efflux pump subunit AcrB
VRTNAMPVSIADLNDIPIKYTNGQTVFLKDVGQVHDGWAVQQNIVRNDGQRSVLLSVLKNGNASTVAVVNGVRKVPCRLPSNPQRANGHAISRYILVSTAICSIVLGYGVHPRAAGRGRARHT